MTLTSGTRLGAYEILTALGAGGMGEVYRARDTRLDRLVAIKILPEALAIDPQFRERFDREARTISQLTHPHICTLYDVGHQSDTAYLVMEYLEGETLENRLKKGALPLDRALKLAIEIADALSAAHRRGIVHRDLKPGNVMLTKSGVKLLDFGLAKASAPGAVAPNASILPTTPPHLTAQGTILGTLQYMAPEQLEGRDTDARTDIFAFGAVVYEMVTGRKAFEAKTQASLIAAILTQEPAPISAVEPVTPPALSRVVKKCLAKDPDARYDSAHDIRDELEWITQGDVDRPVPLPQKGRIGPWLAAVAAVLVVIAGIVLATLYVRRPTTAPLVTQLDVVTPPTSDPFSFALSPDGRHLAFVARAEGLPRLWVRSFDQPAARQIAGTDGASYPFWAPDGHAVGFFADGQVKRVDLTSGAIRVLAGAAVPRGGTWSRDDVILFGAGTPGLTQIPANGGVPLPRTQTTGTEADHRWPQFLPDGRHFIFYAFGSPPGMFMGSLDGGEPVRLRSPSDAVAAAGHYASPGYMLTVLEGALVARPFDPVRAEFGGDSEPIAQSVGINAFRLGAFSTSDAGVLAYRGGTAASGRQLEWVDRTGKSLGLLLPAEDTNLGRPEVSPDGRQVAVTRILQNSPDIWMIDVARGLPSRFTFAQGVDRAPVWSPEGEHIIYGSNANGRSDLFEKPVNGASGEQLLLSTDEDKLPMDWSSDGKYLLYTSQNATTQSDLWVLPLVGDKKPFPIVRTPFDEVHGQFSPDGRWLAYSSNESGRYEVYVRPFPDEGGKWQISNSGGIYPRWRRDGRELFYVSADNHLMAASIEAGSTGQSVNPGVPVALFASRIVTGGNTGIGGFAAKAEYAVTRDGRFLINVTPDQAGNLAPITIVQNWTALLTK